MEKGSGMPNILPIMPCYTMQHHVIRLWWDCRVWGSSCKWQQSVRNDSTAVKEDIRGKKKKIKGENCSTSPITSFYAVSHFVMLCCIMWAEWVDHNITPQSRIVSS